MTAQDTGLGLGFAKGRLLGELGTQVLEVRLTPEAERMSWTNVRTAPSFRPSCPRVMTFVLSHHDHTRAHESSLKNISIWQTGHHKFRNFYTQIFRPIRQRVKNWWAKSCWNSYHLKNGNFCNFELLTFKKVIWLIWNFECKIFCTCGEMLVKYVCCGYNFYHTTNQLDTYIYPFPSYFVSIIVCCYLILRLWHILAKNATLKTFQWQQ